MVSANAASTLARSVTSQAMKRPSPPELAALARATAAAASPAARSMSATTTLAPSSAKRSAVAVPMPPPPPVIKATLPASRSIPLALLLCRPRRCRYDFGVLLGDQVVGQRKAGHRLEPMRPGYQARPTGDVKTAFGHKHHAPPAADVGNAAG